VEIAVRKVAFGRKLRVKGQKGGATIFVGAARLHPLQVGEKNPERAPSPTSMNNIFLMGYDTEGPGRQRYWNSANRFWRGQVLRFFRVSKVQTDAKAHSK